MRTDAEVLAALDDMQALAVTIFVEGRGEPIEGRIAVGSVIRNRVTHPTRFGATYRDVCLAKAQFSGWLPSGGAENFALSTTLARALADLQPIPLEGLELAIFRETWWIAEGLINGTIRDRAHGATHYYAPRGMKPIGRVPAFAVGLTPVAVVNSQLFFVAA